MTHDNVFAYHSTWRAAWRDAGTLLGVRLRVLDYQQTGFNPITNLDWEWGEKHGHLPPPDRIADHPDWDFPPLFAPDGLADRRLFDDWRRRLKVPGRPLAFTYDQVVAFRTTGWANSGQEDRPQSRVSFYRAVEALTYWWVEGPNPNWTGYSWRP